MSGKNEFDSLFHRSYVRGVGPIAERDWSKVLPEDVLVGLDAADVVSQYRKYVGVNETEMSDEEILARLGLCYK